jgi:acetolactate synthase-1/2/3 large subunit
MNGAEVVAATLADAGVKTVFALSGNQIMPLFDAFIDASIEPIHVRHEAAAVHMADAWAQLSGEPGVAVVAAGAGFANALSALQSPRASESPVLLLAGDSPICNDNKGAFQELDQITAARPFTKSSVRAQCASSLKRIVAEAIDLSRAGRPGPVHVALPFDVLRADSANARTATNTASPPSNVALDQDAIRKLTDAICAANRPLVLTGPLLNRSRARSLLTRLESALRVPVVPMESPRGINDPSLGRIRERLAEAEFVLFLGKRVDYSVDFGSEPTFGAQCQFAVIDPDVGSLDQAAVNLGDRIVISERADTRLAASQLAEAREYAEPASPEWSARVDEAISARPSIPQPVETAAGLTPHFVCDAISKTIEAHPKTTLIVDGGEFGQWGQALVSNPTRIINGLSGAIGGGVCHAIAAKLQRPESVVLAIMGDGSIGFHLSEFETAVRYELPFVAIVGNDARWNAEYQIQLRNYGDKRLIGCELTLARYDLAVAGLGGYGEYVSDADQLPGALERAIASGLPACVNIELMGLPAPSFA